ncbi:MAG TPA: glycosyltransferase family 1 protein [Bacteroidota bacterium]|nr:glycosyltransferase family 1 protein [Bacteroidota bacterium]
MHVGIDARKYADFGIGTYIRNLAGAFDMQREHRFTYFVSPADARLVSGAHRGKMLTNSSRKYSLRELVSVSRQANRERVDVFHAPHYTLPLGLAMPSVVTIHDVIHLRFPEYFSPLQRGYARMMIGHAARAARAIIADSRFAADELRRYVRVPERKIHVIPLGVSSMYAPDPAGESARRFRTEHGIDRPFLLYVGSMKPHKNVGLLIRALARTGDTDLQLVCVGERVETDGRLAADVARRGLAQRIRSLGWLREEELPGAYHAATALVIPSLYEGFGLTALEAMACGTPVISSHAASLPEVTGDAALDVSPLSEEGLSDAIRAVTRDETLRTSLGGMGLKRAAQFSWLRCADATLKVYGAIT